MITPALASTSIGAILGVGADAALSGAGASGTSPWLVTALVALVGGAAGQTALNSWHRRRSGESAADASEANAHGAAEVAGAVKDLLAPLREENARLHGVIAEKQARLLAKTEASADMAVQLSTISAEYEKFRHKTASDLTALASEIATLKLLTIEKDEEIQSLTIQLGEAPDRRDSDRRSDSPPGV